MVQPHKKRIDKEVFSALQKIETIDYEIARKKENWAFRQICQDLREVELKEEEKADSISSIDSDRSESKYNQNA